MSDIIEQLINIHLCPWTSKTFHSHFCSNIGIFFNCAYSHLIFFLPSTISRAFLIYFYIQSHSRNKRKRTIFVFDRVPTIESLYRTYFISLNLQFKFK